MGAGIAQLACLTGVRTLVHDPIPEALTRGIDSIKGHLDRGVQRGRLDPADAKRAAACLAPVPALSGLAPAELVIEAAPESLQLKRKLFEELADTVVAPDCVLATNTSSLLVTAMAAGVVHPERVVGMHFFNPAPVMVLLEVVAGIESGPDALALARAAGEAMGKLVIDATDGPGFLVNRCNRPFGLEALKLLQERVAPLEQIDQICRLGGGFRMGPFELMDLVGVDVGFDVSRSFFEQSFGEPRWRPSPITARTVAAGRHGRKTGRGYYDYSGGDGSHRPPDPEPTQPGGGRGLVVIAGETMLALELTEAAESAGWDVLSPQDAAEAEVPALILDLTLDGGHDGEAPLQRAPQAVCCAGGSLAALDPGGAAVGFHALPPFSDCALVELTRGTGSAQSAAEATQHFFSTLGKHTAWVQDAPGLVLGRIICQVANEAAFALGDGVGTAQDIDAGMVHGLNYPRGILSWADTIGLDHVLAVLLALGDERREERYRPAPALRRLVSVGRLGRASGGGFFDYGERAEESGPADVR